MEFAKKQLEKYGWTEGGLLPGSRLSRSGASLLSLQAKVLGRTVTGGPTPFE